MPTKRKTKQKQNKTHTQTHKHTHTHTHTHTHSHTHKHTYAHTQIRFFGGRSMIRTKDYHLFFPCMHANIDTVSGLLFTSGAAVVVDFLIETTR